MRIFVTGASGYIGRAVAEACARAGHDVIGLVRTEAKAKALEAAEIEAVIGAMEKPASYRAAAESCSILIHCAAEMSERFFELDRLTIETLLSAAANPGARRKLILTSGVWVYGDTGAGKVDESSPIAPPAIVAQRPRNEALVLGSITAGIQALVLRPGCVYGGSGGLTGMWFESATKEGSARIVGDGRFRWAWVHLQDLADFYVRAAESSASGEIFNVVDRSRFTVLECAEAASRAAGAGGKVSTVPLESALQTMGPFAQALTLNQHVDSRKAVRLLGWQPRHGGFVDGADRYFAAWKAAQK